MRKIVVISIICLVLLLCGAGIIGINYLNSGYISKKISQQVESATGSPVKFWDEPVFSLLPPSLSLKDVSWQSVDGKYDIKINIQDARIEIELPRLVSGEIALGEVSLTNPSASIILRETPGNPEPSQPENTPVALSLPIEAGRVNMRGGSLSLARGEASLVLDNINLSADNLRRNQETGLECDFSARYANGGAADYAANIALKTRFSISAPDITFRDTAMSCTATTGGLPAWLSPLQLSWTGTLNASNFHFNLASANLALPVCNLALKGAGDIIPLKFRGMCELEAGNEAAGNGQMPSLFLKGAAVLDAKSLALNDMTLKIADTSGSGQIMAIFPVDGNGVGIEGQLDLGALNLAQIIPRHAGAGEPAPSGRQDNKQQSPAAYTAYPALNLQVNVAELNLERLKLEKAAFSLQGAKGIYKIGDFSCQWANGDMRGAMSANLPAAGFEVSASGQKIDLGAALAQMGFRQIEGGEAAFQGKFSASGHDMEALKDSLTGQGGITARNAQISLLKPLNGILAMLGRKAPALEKDYNGLKCDFSAEKGIVTISPLELSSKILAATGSARIDLRSDSLDGKADLKAFGLNLPLTFRGPLDNISLGVDPRFLLNLKREWF